VYKHAVSPFRDRTQAGRLLAERLGEYANRHDVIVLALPRGGVPVAFEVARALHSPLDIFVVRKLGVPGHEELAMGAIATGKVVILDSDTVHALRIPEHLVAAAVELEGQELARREEIYRGERPKPEVSGRIAILVDDGLATGASMRAAVAALRKLGPARIVVAVPVAAPSTCEHLAAEVDEIVCCRTPEPFYAVGLWYENFDQTTDDEVRDLLARAQQENAAGPETALD
jgi:putative phosphoribosyl transferase